MKTKQVAIPTKPIRNFLPQDLIIDSWKRIESFFIDLKERNISSAKELEQWMLDRSELEAVLSEDFAWRYIKMTCDTTSQELTDSYNFFVSEIDPHIAPYSNELNIKLIESPFLKDLDSEKYRIYIRGIKKALELYREENIPLHTKVGIESQKYGAISAAMTIEWEGKEITLQMASSLMKDVNRKIREEVYQKIQQRRSVDTNALNDLFTELIHLRHQVAINAGFKNYRDYKFNELGRFDYNVQDCFDFHESIAKEILPLAEASDRERKKIMKLDVMKPWDMDVDVEGKSALKPFSSAEELTDKFVLILVTICKL